MTVAGAALVVAPRLAMADCVGPTIEHDVGIVDRGDTVQVVGSTWGDSCYDTGRPPPGESAIGNPVTGIEIFLVQGGEEHLVATGDADDEYEFVVEVPVPDDLAPGPVEVIARSAAHVDTFDATPEQLVVSERQPAGVTDDGPIRFGQSEGGPDVEPADTRSTERPPDDDDGSDRSALVGAGVAFLAVGLIGGTIYIGRRRG